MLLLGITGHCQSRLSTRVQAGVEEMYAPALGWTPLLASGGTGAPSTDRDMQRSACHLHINAEVKNAFSSTSIPAYAFVAWCLIKHED
jgi:hypothetical protein